MIFTQQIRLTCRAQAVPVQHSNSSDTVGDASALQHSRVSIPAGVRKVMVISELAKQADAMLQSRGYCRSQPCHPTTRALSRLLLLLLHVCRHSDCE